MPRRILWAAGAAAGGLLTTAFLSTAIAIADTGDASAITDNAFTIGDFTYDPFYIVTDGDGVETVVDGYSEIAPLSQLSPLLGIGGASINDDLISAGLARQAFDLYGDSGSEIGTATANVNVQNLLGFESVQLRIIEVDAGDGGAGGLPAVGSVYSITDFGGGIQNVYIATPDADGGAATITDTLVTPWGNTDLSGLFGGLDATHGLDPGNAFAGLDAGDAGDFSSNAFTIDDFTFDPGVDGFPAANELFGVAPLMTLGGGTAVLPGFSFPLYTQNLDVYGADGTELGTVGTDVNTLNLLGIQGTQFTIGDIDLADGVDASQLPADGTVYSVTNLGGGIMNVYTAVPGAGEDPTTITDTLVTPWGNTDLSEMFAGFDATQPLDPGAALEGLGAGDGGAGDFGEYAFTLDDFTFDPGAEGFDGVTPLFSVAPLLAVGGGSLAGTALAPQDLDVFGSDGNLLGSVNTAVNVSNLFGLLETTQFTVTGSEFADGVTEGLPADGTVYSVTDLGGGWENIYTALPGDDGATITDILSTPYGDMDLGWLFGGFDATAVFNPGDVLAGMDFGDLLG